MPNSAWTESGASISLAPSTTPVSVSSSPEDVNYLTNSDKINLMAQYSAELATKTSLDSTAANLSVSSTAYDNAVAAINTTLINAGAPSNWATAWPDGTTFGPVTGIQTSLSNDWEQVASQRAALQSSIAAANAANAQSAATAAAATDATNKMNSAVATAQSLAPMVVAALPALPNSTYPNGKVVWSAADNKLYQNNNGTWAALVVAGANIQAGTVTAEQIASDTITAGQIAAGAIGASQIAAGAVTTAALTVANYDNLIPNPNSDQTPPSGGWPSGAFEGVYLLNAGPDAYNGAYTRGWEMASVGYSSGACYITGFIPCNPGDMFYQEAMVKNNGGATQDFSASFFDASFNLIVYADSSLVTYSSYNKVTNVSTAPSTACFVRFFIESSNAAAVGWAWFDALYARRMADASLIVDGSITASKIAAGAITADMITTGTLDASAVDITNINASNITTGTLSASKVLFPDGSDMTTAARVSTTKATVTGGGVSVPGNNTVTAIPGLSWTVTAESANDVYNISGFLQASGSVAGEMQAYVSIYVDGNQATNYGDGGVYATIPGGTTSAYMAAGSFLGVITGLAAGSHTIQVYLTAQAAGGNSVGINGFAFCQRVF